jgi:hypothetical protein
MDEYRGCGRAATLVLLAVALAGCATWQVPPDTGTATLRERAITASSRGVEVSAAVLGAEDSKRLLGADVTASGVQPVWVEVRNGTDDTIWMLRSGTDPDYFSPLEVAWYQHSKLGGSTNDAIDQHFDRLSFANPVPPHQTRSGLIYTTPQPVTKLLNVDLWGNRKLVPFSLVLDVPGYESFRKTRQLLAAPDEPVTDFTDLAALRKALEALPHQATTAAGDGGPLNLVLVGALEDIASAGARRGYRRDVRDYDAAFKVFGRAPDYVSRKSAQADASSTWVRAWRTPVSYQGKPVFVAQAARPVGGRFATAKGAPLMSADVDEIRNAFLQNNLYSGGLESVGFLAAMDAVPREASRALPDGSHYFTDGVRAVLFFTVRPLTFADVRRLDWEPFLENAEAGAKAFTAQ